MIVLRKQTISLKELFRRWPGLFEDEIAQGTREAGNPDKPMGDFPTPYAPEKTFKDNDGEVWLQCKVLKRAYKNAYINDGYLGKRDQDRLMSIGASYNMLWKSSTRFKLIDVEEYEKKHLHVRFTLVDGTGPELAAMQPPQEQPAASPLQQPTSLEEAPAKRSTGSNKDKERIDATKKACEQVRQKIVQEVGREISLEGLMFLVKGVAKTNQDKFGQAVNAILELEKMKPHRDTLRDEWKKVPKELKHDGRPPHQ